MQHAIELLAPAGNAAALRAAVRGGADAVYLGLDSFNARRGADNFTLDTLADACAYAHLRGVRVYVTFNTAILPSEVTRALETVRQAYRAGADAFIVQDIGIASEIARSLPEARLHISTQMNTHNAAGIEAAARLGARRVTLARELSLPEIAHLVDVADGLDMEVESFAHGALCVCYSGQCFMSSLIGGRSANRGMCAQACRLPYTLHNKALRKNLPAPGEHLLSPQDLCAIDLLPQLVEAGVTSFKIEGRMKSPEYVFAVTSTYRAVLDRIIKERAASEQPEGASSVQATDEEHQTLAEAFSRGFTTAYLQGKRGNDIMSYGRPNNRGVFVGRVLSAKNGTASIAAERPLVAGDVLEFWTNKGHFAYTIDAVSLDAQGNVRVSPDRPVGKGDRVFRVRSAEAAFEDDLFEPRVAVTGRAVLRIGQPLRVEFSLAESAAYSEAAAATVGTAEGDVVEAARTKPVAEDDVRAHIDRLGQTPFELVALDVELDEGVGIGFSQLHRVRAAALDDLSEQLLAPTRNRALPRVQERVSPAPARPR
ncbi:peptidase U32 family protein, partial [Eggerthella sinensis]